MIVAFGGPLRKPLGGLLRRLGAPFDRLETILGHLGRILDGLGVSGVALGCFWEPLGGVLGHLGGVLGRLGHLPGPSWGHTFGPFGGGGHRPLMGAIGLPCLLPRPRRRNAFSPLTLAQTCFSHP